MKIKVRRLFYITCTLSSIFLLLMLTLYNGTATKFKKMLFNNIHIHPMEDFNAYNEGKLLKRYFSERDLIIRKFSIAANGSDVIVHLRIQKTGTSSLEKELTTNMDISPWCHCTTKLRKDCKCFTSWKSHVLLGQFVNDFPCGVHSDWTVLKGCVEGLINKRHRKKLKQRHLYVTTIRDPLRRYLSEWQVVAFWGSTWSGQQILCNRKPVQIRKCYKGPNWRNVTLKDFMDCSSNLAINRMTRMLANLSIDNCYSNMSHDEKHFRMLASAKENLKGMAYFGLTGYQELSQILFENTFNLKFKSIQRTDPANITKSGKARLNISEAVSQKIVHMNRFDVMLYQFAKDLFFQRLNLLAETTNNNSLRKRLISLTKPVMNQYTD